MSSKSKISWTDRVWHVTSGCRRVSTGCANCFAERLAGTRLRHLHLYDGLTMPTCERGRVWTGEVRENRDRLGKPLRWRKRSLVFVNSMSDLFHSDVRFEYQCGVFGVMAAAKNHVFQVLTKRADLMKAFFERVTMCVDDLETLFPYDNRGWRTSHLFRAGALRNGVSFGKIGDWPLNSDAPPRLGNVFLGVTAENQEMADSRIPDLVGCDILASRWVSVEPMLGPVDLGQYIDRLDWVVIGGESGVGARMTELQWIIDLVKQCVDNHVPVFVKQLGIPLSKKLGVGLHHTDSEALPASIKYRQFPPEMVK